MLVGEVYLPAAGLAPYLEHLDVAFAFELLHAPWEAGAIRAAITYALDAGGGAGRVAWVLSNHDFPRLPDRVGARNVRAAALLAFTLPGPVFVYQGDEIGMADGPGRDPPDDRAGRDRHRHPMRWDDDAAARRLQRGERDAVASVDRGRRRRRRRPGADADSMLALYRDLIAQRRALGAGLEFLDAVADGVLAYRRGDGHIVALNVADQPRPAPPAGAVIRATHAPRHRAGTAPTALLARGGVPRQELTSFDS